MKVNREALITILLLSAVVLLALPAALGQSQEAESIPLANDSTAPDGGRALWLWMDQIGYQLRDSVGEIFALPSETDALMLLAPQRFPGISSGEWNAIDTWVEAGGILIASGSPGAAQHYGFSTRSQNVESLAPFSPFTNSPMIPSVVAVEAGTYLVPNEGRFNYIPLLAHENGLVMVALDDGLGRVILSTANFPFSNQGLQAEGNAEMLLNIFQHIPKCSQVWFDEWHHGKRLVVNEIYGPGNWLRYTPAGRSLLFSAIVLFAAILLSGRRFGRPLRAIDHKPRRAPLEHATAIANLSRRAGHRSAVLADTAERVKRHFGTRYRIDPRLSDEDYLTALKRYAPQLDIEQIGQLLALLRQSKISEQKMLALAIEASELMEDR